MKFTKLILSAAAVFSAAILSISVSAEETTETAVSEEALQTTVTSVSGSVISDEVNLSGWINTDGKWFYYVNNSFLTGKQLIDGNYYIFADNGAMRTDWQTVNGHRRFFDNETHSEVYGWINHLENMYYNDAQYGKLTGLHEIDGKRYIFSDEGIMQTGFVRHNGFIYYCHRDGEIYRGKGVNSPSQINGVQYIILPEGYVMLGWQNVNGKEIYFDYETAQPVYGWIYYGGNYYFSDEENGMYKGECYIENRPYKFSENGIFQYGLQKFSDGSSCYYYEDRTFATGFQVIDNTTYYFDKNGFMAKGWQTINNQKYYFLSNGKMATGFYSVDGNRYYFSQKGIMQTGFTNIDGNRYCFAKDGKMLKEWQTIDGNRYYFGTDGKMRTGFSQVGRNTYYFGDDGIMQTGLKIMNGKYYNLGENGILTPIKVFVGVGHGGYDPGAVGYIVEKEYTLKTAKVVEQHLKDAGIEYILSRNADIDTTMESKLKLCNDYDPDLIIDIHFNAVGGHGFEVYHAYAGGMSKTLAENINAEVEKIMYSTGCKIFLRDGVDRFTIIRETHAPAVLIEGGYVDYYEDAMFIAENYARLAKAYAEGILKTIKLMFGG